MVLNFTRPKSKIAIVDDEVELTQLFQSLLEGEYDVSTFNDPRLFLESLEQKNQPNACEVLISDLKMPKMSGVEMIEEAQKKGHFFPSILLSGHLDTASAIKAVNLGIIKLIEKPTAFETIRHSLSEAIQRKEIYKNIHDIDWSLLQMSKLHAKTLQSLREVVPPAEFNKSFYLPISQTQDVTFAELISFAQSKLEALKKIPR
ncbi:MAG: response regulator [Pseudobdellovibrionaceae bacterium]